MNQEFYISVTPVRENEFLVRTERMVPGVPLAEELVTWHVEAWLEQARQLMHDPLLGILRGQMRSKHRSGGNDAIAPSLVELGQSLYNALFQGTIRDSWMTAQGIAQNHGEGLRLRLGLKGGVLPRLPWEVLYAGARPLATGTDVVFSRYDASFTPMATILPPHRLATSNPSIDAHQPLRILMVLAAPTDKEVLELQSEANHLREELLRDGQGDIELTILHQPGREQLTRELEQGQYQVLHYAGHSNLGVSGGDLYLVSDRTGLTEVLSGDDLAGLLVNNGIRMAVFNSCRGVYTATADPSNETESSNLTEALLKRGIPAVLAMAERIPDDVALTLSRLFYRNLKQRYPIDLSLSRARQGLLSAYGSNQLYWALPILYLRPDFDGYLQSEHPNASVTSPRELPDLPIGVVVDAPINEDELDEIFPIIGFEDPDDSDREAVRKLLEEISGNPSENPFTNGGRDPFFVEPPIDLDESQLTHAQDCLKLGQARYQQGDFTGAIVAFGRAIELDPSCAEGFYQMGVVLEQLNSPTEAIVAYRMALQHSPNLTEARENLQRLEVAHNLHSITPTPQPMPPSQGRVEQGVILPDPPVALNNPGQSAPDRSAHQTLTVEPPARIFGTPSRPATQKRRRPWIAAGVLGTAAAGVLAVWGFTNWRSTTAPSDVLPDIAQLNSSPPPTSNQIDAITASATKSFAQGDLRRGREAVQTLLDQGVVPAADTAIQSVPLNYRDDPTVSFLRGRVAWESVNRSPNTTYSIDDARREWETAAKTRKTPQVYNALGFAYYAQNQLGRAGKAWIAAVRLAQAQQKVTQDKKAFQQDELTAYAGLALVANRKAQSQPPQERDRAQQEAIQLRDRVLNAAPDQFQDQALARNWLWRESAIADWKALRVLK